MGAQTAPMPSRTLRMLGAAVLVVGVTATRGVGEARSDGRDDAVVRHRVLLVGDSLMGNTVPQLQPPLHDAGWDVVLVDAHVNGTGVVGPVGDAPDSLTYVEQQLDRHPRVDTVVIEWAGACATCGTTGPEYGSDAFYAAWRAGAHAIIDFLRRARTPRGGRLHVLWVKSPPMPEAADDSAPYQLREAVARRLASIDGTELGPAAGPVTPDWYEALADTSLQYQESLSYGGGTHQVRADDLVHLTADGAARTARWTAAALAEVWTRPRS